MPDITMCYGEDWKTENGKIVPKGTNVCPFRDLCFRYKAEPSDKWQSVFAELPLVVEHGEPYCDYYDPVDDLFKRA